MERTVDKLRCQWVRHPRDEWMDDLEDMAEGYPFEKKRRSMQGLDRVQQLHRTLDTTTRATDHRFLAAHFKHKLVGWCSLRRNHLHSLHVDPAVYEAEWELIQRNRDDIRASMLEAIRDRYLPDVVHFQQPAQNRTARVFYTNHPLNVQGTQELVLARLLPRDVEPPTPRDIDFQPLQEVREEERRKLVEQYHLSRLHHSPLFGGETAERIYEAWFRHAVQDARTGGEAAIHATDQLAGVVLEKSTPTSFPSDKRSGSIQFIQVGSRFRGQGLGSVLLRRSMNRLARQGVEYVEIKLFSGNQRALTFYRDHGFSPVTKRRHFYMVDPDRVTLPL